MTKVKAGEVGKTVIDLLEKWGDSANVIVRNTALEVGNETAEIVRNSADYGGTGKYRESITCEELEKKRNKTAVVVHAGGQMYRLSHLLENGHIIIKSGKRTSAKTTEYKHFEPGEQYAEKTFPRRLEDRL